jgi:hypothetical protein
MGLFRWQVKRHLKPGAFAKLNDGLLREYARILRIDIRQLTHFGQIQEEI